MESTILHNNNIINQKDEIIKDLKSKKNNNDNDDYESDGNENEDENNNQNYTSNVNIINKEFEEVYKKLSEQEKIIKTKDEKIKELTQIIENSKKDNNDNKDNKDIKDNKDNKENILNQKLLQYKEYEIASQNIINLLKGQIKNLENEIKVLKEENTKKKNDDLFEVVEKMLKLEKQLDKYKNKNDKLQKELDKYKKNNNNINTNNIKVEQLPKSDESNINKNTLNELSNLKKQFTELENKYNEEKLKNKKYETEIEQYKKEINELKIQIVDLKFAIKNNNNNNMTNSNNKDFRLISDSTISNFNMEKYNKNLEQLINAKKEITQLKNQIKKMENDQKLKKSLFRCRTLDDDSNDEEEFDMAQLEEGIKKRNRSEDINIDFSVNSETKKKYAELEERFNNLKEQVVPILKSNDKIDVTKNKVSKICNLLGTSVNTTNNILEKYNK